MFYTTPRLTSDSWYKEPSSDLGDEANWLEVAESAADSLLKSNSLLSGHWNLDKTYDDHIAKVKEITGKELRNPTSLTYGVYESDDERRRFNADLAKYREDGGSLSDWGYSKQWREQEFRRQLGELAAAHPDKTSELLPDMSFLEQSYGVARKAQDREHAVWDRSDKGIGAWSASLAGALWGSAQDPVNWITAPIGFSGVGTGAKGLAMGFLKAGTANAAVEAAVQPFVQSYRSEAGLDSGAEQAATAIGGAFLFGGALDTTVRGIARGLRYSFGYEPIIVNGVVRGYRKRGAAPAIADGAAPSAPGQAEPPPAVDIPAELLARAEKNDRAAIEEIDRIIRGGDDTVITQRTVDQADAGDPKAIREIAEKTGVAGDPIARQSLDAMDANEMLRVKPSDRVPDVDHDAAIAQGLRHASDPEIEPPPVVRDGATPQAMSDIRDMVDDLRAEIKRLEDDVASRPDAKPPADMPDLRIKLAEAESSYRQMRRAIYDDGVIERVDAGDIPPDVADLVAAHVPDKAAQGRAIDDLMARNPGSAREARQMLSEMLASPDYRPDPVDTSPPPAGLKTKALDDPYGKEAAQQVDALKQKMSDELGIGKTQPTPEQQAAEIKAIVDRGDEVRKAIEDMAGLIPEGVPVKTFTALSDLPDSIRAEVEASNALLFADAVIRFQTARSTAERDAARRFLDMAKAGRGVEGIARGGTIWIATYAMNPRGSVAHEVLHVLRTMGKISPAEIKALAEFARNEGLFSPAREATYRKELARRWNAADVVSDILDEEAAAHAVEYRANLGRRLVEPPQVKTVLDRLAEFFAAIRDALKRKGFVAEGDAAPRTAATDVLEAFMSGEMIKRHGELAWMRSFMQAEDLTAVAVRPGYMAAFSSDGGEYRGQHGTPERAKTAGAVTDHSDVYPLKEGRHQIDENGSRLVYKVRDDGSIQIDAVNSLPESAGRGQVRKMVEGLLSVADANNRVVRLDFDPSGDTDPARLRAFYTRLGFTGDRNMVRGPAGPNGDRTGGQADTAGRLNRSLFAFADDKPVTPGLDMSYEARMQRARDMGFDTDNVLFHGTSGDDFEKFTARHQTSGMGLPGVYMTPDANYAATYSGTADGSRIMPLFVRGKIASPAEYQAIWDSVYDNTGGRFSGPALTRLVQDEMLRRGYTGKSSLYENEWPVVVVFDPRNIRSVNAAFDPANADSPNLMFAFAGERAKTADLNALNLAKRMELDGIDRDDIWVKTGWGRGVDGKWRFEIDDSDAQFFGPRGKNLGEWFYTPAYAAYPDLEQIKTPRFEAMMAGRGENAVYRRSLGPIREAMGFGREVEDDAGIHEVQHAIAAREDFEAGGTGFDIMLGRYDRLAGEVEARTVQKRMDMTAAERRARPMWHDYDVPEEQQIVRFGDGVQNSEPLFSIRQDEPDAFDWGDRSTSGSRETKFGNTTITYGVQPRTKYAQVILVETAKADRGQGSAREAMKRFVAEADRNGFTVSLTAEPMGKGGMGKADLVKFYKSLGFVENKGRNKDFAVMAGMIRQPRNQPMFAMAQDQETGRSMRRDLDALGYYSAALEAAKNLKQAKGTPEQMISQLKAGGAKQAELEATGLLKWLEEKSGSRESGKDAGSGAVTEASRRDGVDGVLDAIAKLKRAQVDMEDERLLRALEANVVNARHAARREWERTRQAVDQTVAEAKTGTPITVQGYHGSNRVIEGGVFRGSGYRRFNDLPGTWFATERFVASEYVHGDGSLHVADIHLANPVVIDAGGASLMSIDDLRQRQREWQETGHDGLIVRGINDFDLQPHTQIWVWNAESITGTSVVGPNGDRTSGTSGRADRLKQPSISKSEIVEFLEKNRVGVKEAQRINAPSVEPPAMPQPKPSEGPFKTLLDQARDALARVEEVRQAAGDGGARLVRDATGLAQQIVKAGRRMSVVRDDDGRVTGLSPVSDEIQDAIAQAAEAIAPLVEAARKAGLSDIATALPQYADQLRNAAPDDLVRLAAEVMQTTDIDAIARALDDAVMQRSQPMFAFRRDDGTQKPGGKTRAQMLQEDLAAIEAQFANASGDERKKLHAERAVLLNAEKLEERLDDLDRYRDHWNRRDTPMAAMFSVENTGQAPFHDLSSWRDEIMGRVERMISGPIWGWRKGAVTGDLRRTLNSGVKLNMQNFVREAAGESTKDQLAKEFAKSWLAATEYLRQRFNAAGGDIAKLTGWFMPQWHDADALIKAGREQWVEFILPLLDRKRIVDHDTGVPMTDSALRTMLKEIWRTITSDGYNSLEIGDHMGRGALYKRHMEHRVLHFKNADSWLKYNNEYGGGDVYAAMISYISSMSRDIALMERFGANPELTWHRLKQFVIQEAKLAGPAKSLFDEFSGKIEELRAERKSLPSRIDELRDDLNTTLTTIDRLREEGKKSIRKENRNRGKISELSRDLPAKVKAIEDVLRSGDVQTPKQIELTNRIADLMVEMTEAGAYSVTSRNPVERAERLLQRADEMWKAFAGTTNTPISSTMAGVMSGARNWIGATTLVFAPFSAVTDQATQLAARSFIGMPATRQLASFVSGFTKGSREWALAQGFALDQAQAAFASQNRFVGWTNTRHLTGYIADRSHAFSLLSPMTQATKIGWYLDFTRWMGTLKDKEVIELPDDVQRLFDRHDISGSDWDAIRSAQLEDVNGMPGLTPLMVDKAVGEDLASKYVRMIVRERKQAVVEPTLRGRTAFVSETRPGTPAGELLRSVAMLKSFPTSYMLLIMGRLYHEIMAGRGLKPSTISYGAAVFIVGTLMGAMAKQLKAIGQGRDPEDMTQAKFWAAAFMQSGGVGIFGDFIGSSINRFGGGLAQTIAGPVADRATTLLDLTAGNLAQYANDEKTNAGRELTKFLRQNTPGMLAPWYVRTAYERLIVDKLQELVDPDVHRSYRQRVLTNRKVRPGNEFYWPPGSASRPRMPDLGAAFGAR